ncbi:MAG: YceI family protein [Planctomycetes bacterium]|nr:YceI family protein [Planctomycetota bacterium]
MNRPLLLAAAAAMLAAAALLGAREARSAAPAPTWAGDTVHTFVNFRIGHLGISHSWGRFNDFTATFETGGDALVSSVAFDIKAESVDTGNEKRDQHLRSPDFLNAKQFPSLSFRSTKVKAIDADTAEVTGDLTLHGVTKPLTARVTKVGAGKGMRGEELLGLDATFTLKRSDFGMTHMVGPVGDEVTVWISTEGAKK